MKYLTSAIAGFCLLGSGAMAAPVNGTGDLISDVIFGTGNANGSFTGVNQNNVELGLRGKLRYDINGNPQNTFNYDGDHTYTFAPVDSNAPVGLSAFNFEWSINVDPFNFVGDSLDDLDDLTYFLEIDYDPTSAVDFSASFDPINLVYADHAIGTNTSGNGGGTVAGGPLAYADLIANNNVAQNSWNMGWFEPNGFDPQTEGMFTINLTAFYLNQVVAGTSIDIIYGAVPVAPVPLPAALPLLLVGLGGLGFAGRRRKAA